MTNENQELEKMCQLLPEIGVTGAIYQLQLAIAVTVQAQSIFQRSLFIMSVFSKYKVVITLISFVITGCFLFTAPSWAISGNLGITDNHLLPCPDSPNCVVSQNGDQKHSIEPITYDTDRESAQKALLQVLTVVPRTTVVEQTDNYIHALSKSRIFKFVDDVEFYFPTDEKVIHLRSASRVGESDLGVNRRRMEQIRLALKDLNI